MWVHVDKDADEEDWDGPLCFYCVSYIMFFFVGCSVLSVIFFEKLQCKKTDLTTEKCGHVDKGADEDDRDDVPREA